MLEGKPNQAKVECSRTVLEEVIAYLEKNDPSGEDIPTGNGILGSGFPPPDDGLTPAARAAREELQS